MPVPSTQWTPQTINPTNWYNEDPEPLAAGGFLLQQDGVSKILLQDGTTALDQQ